VFPVILYGMLREANMKVRLGLLVVVALAGLPISVDAQVAPPGSYQRTCREIRMQGPNLIAVCIKEHGRGEELTALNVAHCHGDIRNLDGQLQCTVLAPLSVSYVRSDSSDRAGRKGATGPATRADLAAAVRCR